MSRSKHLLEQLLALARHDAESTDCGQWEVVELDLAAKSVIADLLREAISRESILVSKGRVSSGAG